jgi:hypothetical protein
MVAVGSGETAPNMIFGKSEQWHHHFVSRCIVFFVSVDFFAFVCPFVFSAFVYLCFVLFLFCCERNSRVGC